MPSALSIVSAVTFRRILVHNADTILYIVDGKTVDVMTPECMLEMAKTMIAQARLAMSLRPKEVERTVADGALLMRAGIPLGLSNDAKVLEETRKEAVNNRKLRRYLPGGVKSKEQVGAPAVITHRPTKKQEG